MVLMNCLNVLYKCMKFRWNIFGGYQVIERARFCDGQTYEQSQGGTICMQELWFLCMSRRLNVLYKCMKIRWNTSKGYQVIERTRYSIANDQREITPKIYQAELWFCVWHIPSLCSRSVWSFKQIVLTVSNLQSRQKLTLAMLQGEKFEK